MYYSNEQEIKKIKRQIQCLACEVKNGGGGIGEERDPIFTSSPAYNITDSNIEAWNNNLITPNLQEITDQGNSTTNPIISSSNIQGNKLEVNSVGSIGEIKSDILTENRSYSLPDQSGTIALKSDIIIPINAQGDLTFTQNIVRNTNGTLGYVDRTVITTGSGTIVSPNFSGFVGWSRRLDVIGLTVSVFCSNPQAVGEDIEVLAKVPANVAPFNDLMLYGFLNVPGISNKFDPVLINIGSSGDITIYFSNNNRPTQIYSIDIQQQYTTK